MVKSDNKWDKMEKPQFAHIIYENCIGCGKCIELCIPKAIPSSFIGYISISAEIDKNKCTGCGDCLLACKYGAIELSNG